MYLSYPDQVQSHVNFLQNHGLDIHALEFGNFIRCHALGENQGRGKYAYICNTRKLGKDDLIGLITWCRGKSGVEESFKTYGVASDATINNIQLSPYIRENTNPITEEQKIAARKAYGFWNSSSSFGSSYYLRKKGVGSYGIRFRSSEKYGHSAIVPLLDENNRLWSYQILNADGSKFMAKGSRTIGLFHTLQMPIDGEMIGIAEGYVTAATCLELSGIPMICCFSASNMARVTLSIKKLYPNSSVILFADNDRHLGTESKENKGILNALETIRVVGGGVSMAEPNFDDLTPSKDASDWNDLMRIKGVESTKKLMEEEIMKANSIIKKV